MIRSKNMAKNWSYIRLRKLYKEEKSRISEIGAIGDELWSAHYSELGSSSALTSYRITRTPALRSRLCSTITLLSRITPLGCADDRRSSF